MLPRPDFFDPKGRPYNPNLATFQPVEYNMHEVRQPPAGSFSTIVNREVEHLATM